MSFCSFFLLSEILVFAGPGLCLKVMASQRSCHLQLEGLFILIKQYHSFSNTNNLVNSDNSSYLLKTGSFSRPQSESEGLSWNHEILL